MTENVSKERLIEIYEKISNDPNYINHLTKEEIFALEKTQKRPYILQPDPKSSPNEGECYAFSYWNLRADNWRTFMMYAASSFMFRRAKEWEPPSDIRTWESKQSKKEIPDIDEIIESAQKIVKAGEQVKKLQNDSVDIRIAMMEIEDITKHKEREEKLQQYESAASISDYLISLELDKISCIAQERMRATYDKAQSYKENQKIMKELPRPKRLTVEKNQMPKKVASNIVKRFLLDNFHFNPDEHIQSSAAEIARDPNIKQKQTENIDMYLHTEDIDVLPIQNLKQSVKINKDTLKESLLLLSRNHQTYNSVLYLLRNTDLLDLVTLPWSEDSEKIVDSLFNITTDGWKSLGYERIPEPRQWDEKLLKFSLDPRATRSVKFIIENEEIQDELKHILNFVSITELRCALLSSCASCQTTNTTMATNIPDDTMYWFNMYIGIYYERLQALVSAVSPYRTFQDVALNVYRHLGPEDTAEQKCSDFVDTFSKQLMTQINIGKYNRWVIIDDKEENHRRGHMPGQDHILAQIMAQKERDLKMSNEIVKNRPRNALAENIRKNGPANPGLSDYKSTLGTKEVLKGAEDIPDKERLYLERAKGNKYMARTLQNLEEARDERDILKEKLENRKPKNDEIEKLEQLDEIIKNLEESLELDPDCIATDVFIRDGDKMTKHRVPLKQSLDTKIDDSEIDPRDGEQQLEDLMKELTSQE